MTNKEIIAEIERRFEILFTLSIFFAVLMATYFDIVGGPQKDNHAAFIFFPLVGIYIAGYIFFEIAKLFSQTRFALHILTWSLLAAIASFAMPTIITILAKGPIAMPQFSAQVDTWTFIASMGGIVTLPFAIASFTFAMIFLGMIADVFKGQVNKEISMKNIKLANLAVFIIFFGIALIEALQKGNWIEAALFLALGVISLWADFGKRQ